MRIHCGYKITFDCPQPVPIQTTLSVHPSRRGDLETPDYMRTDPVVEVRQYIDGFGNNVLRLLAPTGLFTMSADFVIRNSRRRTDRRPQPAGRDPGLSAGQPLLRNRSAERLRLGDVRPHAVRLGPSTGRLRLGPRPHRL